MSKKDIDFWIDYLSKFRILKTDMKIWVIGMGFIYGSLLALILSVLVWLFVSYIRFIGLGLLVIFTFLVIGVFLDWLGLRMKSSRLRDENRRARAKRNEESIIDG